MGALKGRKAHQSLLKKGFQDERNRDHIFYYFYYNGKKSHLFTKMSHNPGDLDDYLLSRMAEQLKISKTEFIEFINCNLREEGLISIYLRDGEL